ncbi:MAG: transposase [Opitutaceae bacterium]
MSNHYHLAIETPEPNLVEGMKWLQSTFATRFNLFRNERGHVFQGRYKSILIGEDRPLLGLIDYIHLNPVRAGICAVEGLKSYALSSYPKYFKRSPMRATKGVKRLN